MAGSDDSLKRLEQEVVSREDCLEDVRQQIKERREGMQALRTQPIVEEQVDFLEQTSIATVRELEQVENARHAADLRCKLAEKSLDETLDALVDGQKQIDVLRPARDVCEKQVILLRQEHEAMAAECRAGKQHLLELEAASLARESELETTRGAISSKMRNVAHLEDMLQRERADAESEARTLESELAESKGAHTKVKSEVEDLQLEVDSCVAGLAAAQREKDALDLELENSVADHSRLLAASQDALRRAEAKAQAARGRSQDWAKQCKDMEAKVQDAEAQKMEVTMKLQTIREEVDSGVDELHVAETRLKDKQQDLSTMKAMVADRQVDTIKLESESEKLKLDVLRLEEKLQLSQSSDVPRLEKRLAEVLSELEEEERSGRDALIKRGSDIDKMQSTYLRQRSEVVRRTNEEAEKQIGQIDTLEAERLTLTQQVEAVALERTSLLEGISEHERVHQGLIAEFQRKAKERLNLTTKTAEMREATQQLKKREAEVEVLIAAAQQKDAALRSEAAESSRKLKVQQEREAHARDLEREVDVESRMLDKHGTTLAKHRQEKDELLRRIDKLKSEEAAAVQEYDERGARVVELEQTISRTRGGLAETIAERQRCLSLMCESSMELRKAQTQREKLAQDAVQARKNVTGLEESLQQLSDELVRVQEEVRQKHAEEEELKVEMQKAQDSVRVTSDRMTYQVEHDHLQEETIEKLMGDMKRCEDELQILTLGLHGAEQRNEHLQAENTIIQHQVEALYKGSLQEWAKEVHRVKVVAEIAMYKDEVEEWKQKCEDFRSEKQTQLSTMQKKHEQVLQTIRDSVVTVQAEIAAAQQRVIRREGAPVSGVPGLFVIQRPLPANHARRKALLVGINYARSHAPLKGCINDVWNLQCLLRYTLQFSSDQLKVLIDGADGAPPKIHQTPTKANILAGLQWLVSGAQPGDNLFFIFSGYGAQQPWTSGSEENVAFLVPSDFAADLPANFFASRTEHSRTSATHAFVPDGTQHSYRLIPLFEISECLRRLPTACRMTVLLDCCYSVVPGVSPSSNISPTFLRVDRGRVEYNKLRDYISRPRFLDLPILPVQHTSPQPLPSRTSAFPTCWLHVFSACKLKEWCAEFPIEGTVQGAFSWAFLKALVAGHFHCGVYQFQRMLTKILLDLKTHFKGVEQTPVVQLSHAANLQDIVLEI